MFVSLVVFLLLLLNVRVGVGLPFAEKVRVEVVTSLLDALVVQFDLADVLAAAQVLRGEEPNGARGDHVAQVRLQVLVHLGREAGHGHDLRLAFDEQRLFAVDQEELAVRQHVVLQGDEEQQLVQIVIHERVFHARRLDDEFQHAGLVRCGLRLLRFFLQEEPLNPLHQLWREENPEQSQVVRLVLLDVVEDFGLAVRPQAHDAVVAVLPLHAHRRGQQLGRVVALVHGRAAHEALAAKAALGARLKHPRRGEEVSGESFLLPILADQFIDETQRGELVDLAMLLPVVHERLRLRVPIEESSDFGL